MAEAKKLKNQIKHRLSTIKNEYFLSQLDIHAQDTKKFWRTMNDLTNKNVKQTISRVRNPDDGNMLSTEMSAEALNEYFVTAAGKLVEKLPDVQFEVEFPSVARNFKLDEVVTCNSILRVINDFSPMKASGCLKISSRLYLDSFEVILEPLAYVMNLCLRSGIFPAAWKSSVVTPIPKKGDRCQIGNSQPISLIHLAGKILEKIVNSTLTSHFQDQQIISKNQFGFTKGHSTIDCIMTLYSRLISNINNRLYTCCLFLDYSKAFDTVNHSILLGRLSKYGILDVEWFNSYLTNRYQRVKLASHFSTPKKIQCGVPQGSVLGPTLFNIYLNDINFLSLSSSMLLYADDVVMFLAGSDPDAILGQIQQDLSLICKWSASNKLSVSIPKSKFMIIGRKMLLQKSLPSSGLSLGGVSLEAVHEFCYLGVTIDDILSFNPMIDMMHRKAAYRFRTPNVY